MKAKQRLFVLLSLVTLLAMPIPKNVSAQGIELGSGVVATAEVVAIDRVDRNLTLRGPEGDVVTIEVSHAARNFDQIEVGDQVKAEYYESVTIYIGKHGAKPQAAAGLVTARATEGQKPAAVAVEAVDVSATVVAIDKNERNVTLELPDGRKVTTRVDKSVNGFDDLKKGDAIHARYTEAMAISVEKP